VAGDVSLMQAANRDKTFVTIIRVWKDLSLQDVAKKGLKYGDEGPEAEMNQVEGYTEQYRLLLDLFAKNTNDLVKEVIIPTVWFPALVRSSSMRMVTPSTWRSFSVSINGSHANLCS